MTSPLQLKDYVFVKTKIEANSMDAEKVSKAIAVDTDIQLSEGKEEGEWMLSLTVQTLDSTEQPSAYKADVVVVGRFDVDPNFPKEKTPRMVAVTGATMLYGAAREMVANITARSVYGIYTLPTTSFVDLEPQKLE